VEKRRKERKETFEEASKALAKAQKLIFWFYSFDVRVSMVTAI